MSECRGVGFSMLGTVLAVGLVGAIVGVALAGPFEDARAALGRGDRATAERLFRSLAQQGHADAQFYLGILYTVGDGVLQNYAEAAKWHHKAAQQGHADAQQRLGHMYESGQGVLQNYAEAAKWYRKAAEQGDVLAQFGLGRMYESGQGVLQNYVQAHMWWNVAASVGGKGNFIDQGMGVLAAQGRERVAAKMTPAQIAEAQAMAKLCVESNYKDCG